MGGTFAEDAWKNETLFVRAPNWKQPKCLGTADWIRTPGGTAKHHALEIEPALRTLSQDDPHNHDVKDAGQERVHTVRFLQMKFLKIGKAPHWVGNGDTVCSWVRSGDKGGCGCSVA